MRMTFLVARNLAVSPFDVMSQDIEFVIMIVNFLVESASNNEEIDEPFTEKDKDRDFWSAL